MRLTNNPYNPKFFTQITPSAREFIDRFLYVVDYFNIPITGFDYFLTNPLCIRVIKFDCYGMFQEMMKALMNEFPQVIYDRETNSKMPWNISQWLDTD